jgi:outer membrane protein assembly factor BamB
MKHRIRLVTVLAACAVLLAACDWSQARFGSESAGFNPETTFSVGNVWQLSRLWSAPVPTTFGPVFESGDTVVSGGRAFDARTGQLRWSADTSQFAAAAIAGDAILGTTFTQGPPEDISGVQARDLHTGAVRWSNVGGVPSAAGAIVADGLLLVRYGAIHGSTEEIDAIDSRSGQFRWGTLAGSGPTASRGVVYKVGSEPFSADTGNYLWANDLQTKALKWKTLVPPCPGLMGNSVPVVANDRVYANGHTFDAATGRLLFNWPVCPASPATAATSLVSVSPDWLFVPYLAPDGAPRLASLDARTGALEWSISWVAAPPANPSAPKGLIAGAPAIEDGVLFGVEVNALDFSVAGNHVIAVNAASGARLWDSPRNPSNDYSDPIVANGVLYARSAGHLDAFHLSG